MNVHRKISENLANEIWDILMEECGATEHWRNDFVFHASTDKQQFSGFEYRFQGSLGFGGKFWNDNGRLYVNCYREDETPVRLAAIAAANRRLSTLKESHGNESE